MAIGTLNLSLVFIFQNSPSLNMSIFPKLDLGNKASKYNKSMESIPAAKYKGFSVAILTPLRKLTKENNKKLLIKILTNIASCS